MASISSLTFNRSADVAIGKNNNVHPISMKLRRPLPTLPNHFQPVPVKLRRRPLPPLPTIINQTPNYLFEATDGTYDSLPQFEAEGSRIKRVAKKILEIIGDVTLLIPIIKLLAALILARPCIKLCSSKLMKNLTPIAAQRLQEREKKIQEIAEKVGISKPKKIKLFLLKCGSPAAATGDSTLIISPEYLVKPEDLPPELKLERLDKNQISEEEWVVKFNKWLRTSFCPQEIKPYKSKVAVDADIASTKAWLGQFRNQTTYEKNIEGVVGHELGHCYYNHTTKLAFANFGLSLLSISTLGFALIFKEHLMTSLKNKYEKQADLFSAEKFGPEGLINFFSALQEAGKSLLTKYPGICDVNGDNPKDRDHPPLSARISYLQKQQTT